MNFGGIPFGGMPHNFGRGNSNDDTLYKELAVERNSSKAEIKKAYHKLVLKNHPDKGGDAEKFRKIQTAYEVLSDDDKRSKYDRFGMDGIREDAAQPDGSDIFDIFFGGARRRNGPPRRRKGKDTIYTLKVTLNDLYNGKKQKIAIHRKVIVGEADTCKHCNGSGIIRQRRVFGPGMIQEIQSPCNHCGGHGKNYKFNNEKTTVDINILPGSSSDTKIRCQGLGNEIPDAETGDVLFTLDVEKHKTFARKGDNLFLKLRISLLEALTGASFDITHLDGRVISIGTNKDSIIGVSGESCLGSLPFRCIPSEGMPILHKNGEKGSLLIAFIIEFPPNGYFNMEQKEKLKEILPKRLHKSQNSNLLELQEVDSNLLNELNRNERQRDPFGNHEGVQCAQM